MVFESEKIQIDAVISTYGSTVTIETATLNPVLDDWGEPVETSSSSRVIKAVPDADVVSKFSRGSQGKFDDADLILTAQGDEVFDTKLDTIIFDGKRYKFLSLEKIRPADVMLANILTLASE
jgi:hypothetical protein